METDERCPLCGKPIDKEDVFCNECQNHVDNQYKTDFLEDSDRHEDNNMDNEVLPPDPATPTVVVVVAENKEKEEVANPDRPKNRKRSKGIIFFFIGCILIVVVGTISVWRNVQTRKTFEIEQQYWDRSVEANTPVSYSKYLVSYPHGEYVEEAELRIREFRENEIQTWQKVKIMPDINDLYSFLKDNPETPFLQEARILIDSVCWDATLKDNTADAYKAYIENVTLGNITGLYKDLAKDKYNYLSQIEVLEGSSLDNLKIEINNIFAAWSENNQGKLLKVFAPKVNYYGAIKNSTDLVLLINKTRNDKDVKSVILSANPETVSAKKDNQGIVFVNLSFTKKTTYNNKKIKDEQTTETVDLELSANHQIMSIKTHVKPN